MLLPDHRKIEYILDGQNRRVGKKVNGRLVEAFIYQSQTQLAAELDGSGNLIKRFVYASKSNVPDFMIYHGKKFRIISDPAGTPRLVIDLKRNRVVEKFDFDEFGVPQEQERGKASHLIPFGFAGGLFDRDTKLVHFGAREYDPETGRWLSKDPIFPYGGINAYEYALNDPVNFTDPTGKVAGVDDALIVGGAIVVTGAVVGIASGLANYQATGSFSIAFNAAGSGFISGATSAGAAILTTVLGGSTLVAAGVATGVDLGISFLTAPTAIPPGSESTFLNGVLGVTGQQPNACSGH